MHIYLCYFNLLKFEKFLENISCDIEFSDGDAGGSRRW